MSAEWPLPPALDFAALAKVHPETEACPDDECLVCGWRDCPEHEPLHYHHDGCPCCTTRDYYGVEEE